MSPQEGWNLFRRIQRKAKKYFEESEEFTHKREYLALEDMDASNLFTTQFRMVKVSEKLQKSYNYSLRLKADYLYDKIEQSRLSFIASLTEKQQKLLNSLYG